MPRKKPEMAQVAGNEFIFGENGGKGKHLLLFLKNLLLTNSPRPRRGSDSFREANSEIYGSLTYEPRLQMRSVSHTPTLPRLMLLRALARLASRDDDKSRLLLPLKHKKFYDLDDDWDAAVEVQPQPKAPEPEPKGPSRYERFARLLEHDKSIDLQELRSLAWNGIPPELRALTWQLLLGYLPTNKLRQASTLKRKREEYANGIANSQLSFNEGTQEDLGDATLVLEKQLYHQIRIDVKRTNPTIKLYQHAATQASLRRILYLWAIRHPASGYVQGINDLCTPFYQIFLAHFLLLVQCKKAGRPAVCVPGLLDVEELPLWHDEELMLYTLHNFDPALLPPHVALMLEADTYWCLLRLLENITDNYIHEQPGIIRQVRDLRVLISKIDLPLLQHFDAEGIDFIQFSFRWMNCLLMRELELPLIVRMWDTYLSETPLGFNHFHVYVCAAFLIKFSGDVKALDFQEIMLFLQNPPTQLWTEKDIELMLSEAYIWLLLYKNAGAHLRN